jgi:hypothetical protein
MPVQVILMMMIASCFLLRRVFQRPCVADMPMQQLKMTKFPAAAPLKAARAVLNRPFLQMMTPMDIWYFCNCASS